MKLRFRGHAIYGIDGYDLPRAPQSTKNFFPMAEASDIGELSYFPFNTLLPTLQLSLEMISILTMMERLVLQLCHSRSSGLDDPLPATVSSPLS